MTAAPRFIDQDYPMDCSKSHFIRVHASQEVVQELAGYLSMEADKILAYYHTDGTRDHAHILVFNYPKCKKTMTSRIKSWIPGLTSDDYAISAIRTPGPTAECIQKAIIYMTKGKYDACWDIDWTKEYLDWCKSQWNPKASKEPSLLQIYWNEWNESPNKYIMIHYGKYAGYDTEEEMLRADNHPKNPNTWEAVHTKALAFTISKAHGMVSTSAVNLAKQLANTFCYRNKISYKV